MVDTVYGADPIREAGSKPNEVEPSEGEMLAIRKAAEDIRTLVSYLARREYSKYMSLTGVDLAIPDRILAGEHSRELEDALWRQLATLSQAAKPASAESIADSNYYPTIYGIDNNARSKASRILRYIRWSAMAALFVTFFAGIYVSLTAEQVRALRQDIDERTSLINGNVIGTRMERKSEDESSGVGGANTQASAANGGAEVGTLAPLTDAQRLENAHDELEAEITNGFALLLPVMWITGAPITLGYYEVSERRYVIFNRVPLETQENFNRIIDSFLIPMLGAFLGVAVFIIRDTAQRMESVSLSPMDTDAYWPRIILGLIAGLTIGWLTTPAVPGGSLGIDTAALGVFANLSKAALAFVVGYSIEVLFNVLDAIKVALGVMPARENDKGSKEETKAG